jgi:hypothetical protein
MRVEVDTACRMKEATLTLHRLLPIHDDEFVRRVNWHFAADLSAGTVPF